MQTGRFRMRTVRGVAQGWLVMLGVSACAMAAAASPALALEPSEALICSTGMQADEVAVSSLPAEPANGATVPAGTPVVFSANSFAQSDTPTFSVASSPTLLSSPDIDSGTGAQSGASYTYTSTKASATPRTIYWTASFTFTVKDCTSPSTFTTPVRTLIVAPSEAELAASKKHQEEEEDATKKKSEEEVAAKKQEEETAASGSVVLDGATISVQNSGKATVELTCSDVAPCTGKLTLTATVPAVTGKIRHDKTESIATASFSITAGKEATIKLTLDKTGRARLSTAHGRLNATLTILRTSPPPNETRSLHVHLDLKARKGK